MGIDIKALLKILPQLIRENDEVKGAILTALSGVVATREDIKDLIREMDRRFDAVDKRFEAMQQQLDKRFEAMQQQLDKRFEAMQQQLDKRFEAMDKRFEAMDKRFEAMQQQLDKRFDTVYRRLDEQALSGLEYFEDFTREAIRVLLADRGIHATRIRPIEVLDPAGEVSPGTTRVEFDVLLDMPPVVAEVTAKTIDLAKVARFIAKANFIDKVRGTSHRRLFLTKEVAPAIRGEVERLLAANAVELVVT